MPRPLAREAPLHLASGRAPGPAGEEKRAPRLRLEKLGAFGAEQQERVLAKNLLDECDVLRFGQSKVRLAQKRDQASGIEPGGRSARGNEGSGKRARRGAKELQRG